MYIHRMKNKYLVLFNSNHPTDIMNNSSSSRWSMGGNKTMVSCWSCDERTHTKTHGTYVSSFSELLAHVVLIAQTFYSEYDSEYHSPNNWTSEGHFRGWKLYTRITNAWSRNPKRTHDERAREATSTAVWIPCVRRINIVRYRGLEYTIHRYVCTWYDVHGSKVKSTAVLQQTTEQNCRTIINQSIFRVGDNGAWHGGRPGFFRGKLGGDGIVPGCRSADLDRYQ